jgi:hypothetical protein
MTEISEATFLYLTPASKPVELHIEYIERPLNILVVAPHPESLDKETRSEIEQGFKYGFHKSEPDNIADLFSSIKKQVVWLPKSVLFAEPDS